MLLQEEDKLIERVDMDVDYNMEGKSTPRLSFYLPVCLFIILVSIFLFIYQSIYLFIYLSTYLSIYLSIYLSLYLPFYLSSFLLINLSIY